ncbi:hypothetical protein FRC18_010801 [Serendipita sp. 400]|nr:hypothetical protein FRC18_010801 [Serendipita sp. 400]
MLRFQVWTPTRRKLSYLTVRSGRYAPRMPNTRNYASTSPNTKPSNTHSTQNKSFFSMPSGRKPQISMTFGVAMMVFGLIGWIYYPEVAQYEIEKRKGLKKKQPEDVSLSPKP